MNNLVMPQRAIPFPQQILLLPDELLYSYLQRTAIAHGYTKFVNFIYDYTAPVGKEPWRAHINPPYDCNRAGLDFGFTLPNESFFLRTSLFPGISCLLSRGDAARYVNGFWSLRHGKTSASVNYRSFIEEIKRCPECWKEDKEKYGSPYFHRAHNMPGVSVCTKHCCNLEIFVGTKGCEFLEDNFKLMEDKENAMEYAIFAKDLLEAGIQASLLDIAPAVAQKLEEIPLYVTRLASYMPWIYDYTDSCNHILNIMKNPMRNCKNTVGVMAILMGLFTTVENLKKKIKMPPIQAVFEKETTAFELVSAYRDDFVMVRCKNCGHVFGSTPHALIVDMGCPNCTKSLSDSEILNRMFLKANSGLNLITEPKNYGEKVTIEDPAIHENFKVSFDSFINFGQYSEDGYKIPDVVLDKDTENFNNLAEEIAFYEGFKLIDATKYGDYRIKVRIKHETCGGEFSVNKWTFKRYPVCRLCDKDYNVFNHNQELPTDEIMRQVREWGEDVIFSEDFHGTYNKRELSDSLRKLRNQKAIKKLTKGAFCLPEKTFTSLEIMEALHVRRHGKRIGLRCGDLFLSDIGETIPNPVPFVVYKHNKDFSGRRKIGDFSYWAVGTTIEITEDNWKPLSILFLLKHSGLWSYKGPLYKVLKKWIRQQHLTLDDFAPYFGSFSYKVSNTVKKYLKKRS